VEGEGTAAAVAGAARPGADLSDAALIVLRDLDEADGKAVLRAAIKQLIAAGTWRVHTLDSRKRKRKRRDGALLLVPGGGGDGGGFGDGGGGGGDGGGGAG
jgi:uncharacterized membrane protein YgcG